MNKNRIFRRLFVQIFILVFPVCSENCDNIQMRGDVTYSSFKSDTNLLSQCFNVSFEKCRLADVPISLKVVIDVHDREGIQLNISYSKYGQSQTIQHSIGTAIMEEKFILNLNEGV